MYGLRVSDKNGNSSMITENNAILVSCGNLVMPAALNADGTYGVDISLPAGRNGSYIYPVSSIGVLAFPTKINYHTISGSWYWAGLKYPFSFYANPSKTYYTKSSTTGVMSAWVPGNMTYGTSSTWDGMKGAFPLASWDYLPGVTEVSKIRLWAAMCYIVYDASAAEFKSVYTIGSNGVSEINYAIYIKKN